MQGARGRCQATLHCAQCGHFRPLDVDQANALLDAVDGHRWAALYRLAVNLGLREGELLRLTWDAIDFKAKTLRVCQQLQRVNGVFVLQTTKTKAGERVLMLDDDLLALLRMHRKNQAEERLICGPVWKDRLNLIFVTETGAPIHASCLVDISSRRWSEPGCRRFAFTISVTPRRR